MYLLNVKQNRKNSASSHTTLFVSWLRLYDWNSPKSSYSLMNVSSYILREKEGNKHWILWYCKCVLGTDLCFFVKSIWHLPSALLCWLRLTQLHFVSFHLHRFPIVLSIAFAELHVTSLFLVRDFAAL